VAVFVVAAIAFGLLVGRVVILQTVEAADYREAGVAQRETSVTLRADRGTIFDRDGTELAISVPSVSIYANPTAVADPAGTAHVLATVLRLPAEEEARLAADLADRDREFVYVARLLDQETADAVLALDLAGIDGVEEPKRIRAAGDLGLGVIGRTDPFGAGATGLELQYDDTLQGTDGRMVKELDGSGRSMPGGSRVLEPARPGTDLVLTLDRSVQYQVEQALLARVEQLQARGGHTVVMDVDTGELYAVASVRRGDDGVARTTSGNLAAVEAYEPGSVAKVFSIAAALDQGVATPDTYFEVPGVKIFDQNSEYEFKITDAYPHDVQPMSVRDILVHSSNIGTWLVAERLGSERLGQYLDAFGFGRATGLGFPRESRGIVKPADEWQGTERVTVSYGYGFAATALQLAAAVNVVANGGVYVSPKLVLGTIDASGELVASPPSETRQVLRPETAAQMRDLMTDVVCEGTAQLAQLPGISVAGKTGTGYKVQDNGTYEGDDGERAYFATFVGFFPADDPEVTILVSIDEPDPTTRDRFGGTAAAPVFADLSQVAIHELQVEPSPGDAGCPSS
jgi:cell division protein FtsI (penicillin-binding protein 3)